MNAERSAEQDGEGEAEQAPERLVEAEDAPERALEHEEERAVIVERSPRRSECVASGPRSAATTCRTPSHPSRRRERGPTRRGPRGEGRRGRRRRPQRRSTERRPGCALQCSRWRPSAKSGHGRVEVDRRFKAGIRCVPEPRPAIYVSLAPAAHGELHEQLSRSRRPTPPAASTTSSAAPTIASGPW